LSVKKNQIISAGKDLHIKIWEYSDDILEVESEKPYIVKESKISILAHDEEINIVKISPNDKIIASAGYDKKIKIWNNNLEELNNLIGHKRSVTDLSFNKYAKLIASASTDKTIKIWNLHDSSCIKTLEGHLSSVLKIHWVYYGTQILSSKISLI
jgi:U3 small nucleolar RNA-associated protein 13